MATLSRIAFYCILFTTVSACGVPAEVGARCEKEAECKEEAWGEGEIAQCEADTQLNLDDLSAAGESCSAALDRYNIYLGCFADSASETLCRELCSAEALNVAEEIAKGDCQVVLRQ